MSKQKLSKSRPENKPGFETEQQSCSTPNICKIFVQQFLILSATLQKLIIFHNFLLLNLSFAGFGKTFLNFKLETSGAVLN